jgi:hypothetical protein
MNNIFKKLEIAGWRQFSEIDIDFHPQLTIITGANGSGKSTLLNILSRHIGVERPYLSIPKKNDFGGISFVSGISSFVYDFIKKYRTSADYDYFGNIDYQNKITANLRIPKNVGNTYSLEIENQQHMEGVHIGPYRTPALLQSIPHLGITGLIPNTAYNNIVSESNSRYLGHNNGYSLIFRVKEALINWAIFGESNTHFTGDKNQKQAFENFQILLQKVLPENIGFKSISIRQPEVVLITETGEFAIDASSGGISTIIEIAALIYSYSMRQSDNKNKFVVTLDEPENHLHPSMQKTLIPNLMKAFPEVQFIIATHSPFIVSSVKNSHVYALRYKTNSDSRDPTTTKKVFSEKLEYETKAGSASEILRDVLGISSTLPNWVEKDLEAITNKFGKEDITPSTIKNLKEDLKQAGLGDYLPEALSGLVNDKIK